MCSFILYLAGNALRDGDVTNSETSSSFKPQVRLQYSSVACTFFILETENTNQTSLVTEKLHICKIFHGYGDRDLDHFDQPC